MSPFKTRKQGHQGKGVNKGGGEFEYAPNIDHYLLIYYAGEGTLNYKANRPSSI